MIVIKMDVQTKKRWNVFVKDFNKSTQCSVKCIKEHQKAYLKSAALKFRACAKVNQKWLKKWDQKNGQKIKFAQKICSV